MLKNVNLIVMCYHMFKAKKSFKIIHFQNDSVTKHLRLSVQFLSLCHLPSASLLILPINDMLAY